MYMCCIVTMVPVHILCCDSGCIVIVVSVHVLFCDSGTRELKSEKQW